MWSSCMPSSCLLRPQLYRKDPRKHSEKLAPALPWRGWPLACNSPRLRHLQAFLSNHRSKIESWKLQAVIWVRLNKVASKGEAANMMGVQWVGGPEHPSLQRPGPGSRKTNGAYEGFFARTFRFSVCIAQRHLSGCIFKCHMRVQT